MRLRYPILIESGDQTSALGVIVRDLRGGAAGDTLEEVLTGVEEAAAVWIDVTLDAGDPMPSPSYLDTVRDDPAHAVWSIGLTSLDPALLDDRSERVNITLPRRVSRRLDTLAIDACETRSGYIAKPTLTGPEKAA